MPREHHRLWVWDFPVAPASLWPHISDTARFNEAAGTPRYSVEEIPQADGSVIRCATASYKGVAVEWDDPPYEWVAQRAFRQMRIFRRGPLAWLGPSMQLEARPDGGSRVTYRLQGAPRGLVGHMLFATGLLDRIGKGLEEMVRHAAAHAAGMETQPYAYTPPPPTAEQQSRLTALARQLEDSPYHHGLADRLAGHIATSQEVDLVRIRPRKLAREWHQPLRPVTELCLEATRLGLLGLSWNLLCPRCGGAKANAGSLDRLPKAAHCSSCNISYDGSFTSNIEISFHPSPAVRSIGEGEFCMGGPHVSRHILVQQILQPGETRSVSLALPEGEYRLRTLEPGGECVIRHDGRLFPVMVARDTAPPAFEIAAEAGEAESIVLRNDSSRVLTFVIEDRAWRSDALTAHEVTTLQAFRDLLPTQVLRPGEDVGIDSITLLFTDLEGSTALYEKLGDGAAYRLVRRHFGFLAATIRGHDGALVKTIGDAVMAVFTRPEQAVATALEIRDRIEAFNADYRAETAREDGAAIDAAIVLKMGLHGGRCIAVNLNDRLDYFGSTVNMAARLQGRSQGGEIVLSETLAADPAVAPLLAGRSQQRESATLKGFETPVPFVRLTARPL